MRNRPIRHGGLVSEVEYSSSTCRIQQECQVGVLGRTNGMMFVISLSTREMLHLKMNRSLLFSQDQFARAQAVLDKWLPFCAVLRHSITQPSDSWNVSSVDLAAASDYSTLLTM